MTFSPLATPAATREVLARHGHSPRKSLGQNFLIDDNVVGRILELSDLRSDDLVLEVGPGIGTLTAALLQNCAGVVAIERDPSLPEVLADTLADSWDRLSLVKKDALDVTRDDLMWRSASRVACDGVAPDSAFHAPVLPSKLVANLPYAVAATVVLGFFQQFEFLESMTVMVQKEVAQRMQATPGSKNYGAYSVKLSLYADSVGSFAVSPGCFLPAPHVDSAVIRLNRIDRQMPSELVRAACIMADAAFFARRKTISNSFKQFFAGRADLSAERIPDLLAEASIDAGVRGEVLEQRDFIALAHAFMSLRG